MTSDPLLITCVGVNHDLALLPHFLAHYRGLGIGPDAIVPILNARSADDPALDAARKILADYGVHDAEIWIAPYTSATMWDKRHEVQMRYADRDRWIISADVDEFHEYPEPLPAFLAGLEAQGVEVVDGPFIDRLATGGRLVPVAQAPGVLDQFPIQADVIWSIAGQHGYSRRGTVKLMAFKGDVQPSLGGHVAKGGRGRKHLYNFPLGEFPEITRPKFRFAVPTRVHHIHWTETLPERLRARLATPGVSTSGGHYAQIQLDHFAANDGVALDKVAQRDAQGGGDWNRDFSRIRRLGRMRKSVDPIRRRLTGFVPRIRQALKGAK